MVRRFLNRQLKLHPYIAFPKWVKYKACGTAGALCAPAVPHAIENCYKTHCWLGMFVLSAALMPIAAPWLSPATAHNVAVAGEIAGTWHVEPSDTPKAGEPSTLWVALTRRGGEILPLNQANCQLNIFDAAAPSQPILQPTLQPIDAEQYQGIPSAVVTFPKPGRYSAQLKCLPKTAADFTPFEMASDITVATGASMTQITPGSAATRAAPSPPSLTPAPDPSLEEAPTFQPSPSVKTNTNWRLWVIGGAAIVGVTALVAKSG